MHPTSKFDIEKIRSRKRVVNPVDIYVHYMYKQEQHWTQYKIPKPLLLLSFVSSLVDNVATSAVRI